MAGDRFIDILKKAIVSQVIEEAGVLDRSPAKISNLVKKVVLSTNGSSSKWGGTRIGWVEPDYDFKIIEKAVSTDSYLSRAITKYNNLLWKNGYSILTDNQEILKYIRQRMVLHTFTTGEPFNIFLERLSKDLIKYHNVLIYIKRIDPSDIGPLGKKLLKKLTPLDGQYPAVAYELVPVTTIKVEKDEKNNVKNWKQEIPGIKPKEYAKNEIIHVRIGAGSGKLWGDPFVRPVIDDVKAYRQLEEDAILISHQMVEPKLAYKVGNVSLPQTIIDLDDDQIEEIATALQFSLENGAIVMPGSHDISVLDTKNAQDITNYMVSLKSRIFGGLGLSPVHFGEAGDANRSVTDRLDVQLYDDVKAYQRVISAYITYFIFAEWLAEAGFDIDFSINGGEQWAEFVFEEIDTDSLIKKQNHFVSLWVQNAIGHDELRKELGRLPMSEQEKTTLYADMVGAIAAKYAQTPDRSEQQKTSGGDNQGSNAKTRAQKTSSLDKTPDIEDIVEDLKEDILLSIAESNYDDIEHTIDIYTDSIKSHLSNEMVKSFNDGYINASNQAILAGYQLKSIRRSYEKSDISESLNDIAISINRNLKLAINEIHELLDNKTQEGKKNIYAWLDSEVDKVKDILAAEKLIMYNYGVISFAQDNDIDEVAKDNSNCQLCGKELMSISNCGLEELQIMHRDDKCKCIYLIV